MQRLALRVGTVRGVAFRICGGGLGYLALLRNFHNMARAGCDREFVRDTIEARRNGAHRVLPFRFVAAARAAPEFEPSLDRAMVAGFTQLPKLRGRTALVVDVYGSMQARMSVKSDLTRLDAAAALAAVVVGSDAAQVHEAPSSRTSGTQIARTGASRDGVRSVPSSRHDCLLDVLNEKDGIGYGETGPTSTGSRKSSSAA